ncbi:MAG: SseB family protein [Clostridiales bacterium]|nr:SseB family protein [Clostridiales bacterium]
MTYKEVGFRAFYQHFCGLPITDEHRKLVENYPGADEADSMLVYGYIDHTAGMTLEVLCLAVREENSYHFFDTQKMGRVSLKAEAVQDLEFAFFADKDGHLQKRYQKQIQELEKGYKANENVEKTRELTFLDPVRHPCHPDDILVFLLKDGLQPEGRRVRIHDLDGHTFIGELLEEPEADFGYHQGETIAFVVQEDKDHHVFCCSNMNPSRKLKASDLEDGRMLKEAVSAFNKERTQDHLLDILELLRDSWVWIPCTAIPSEQDHEAVLKMLQEAGDDPSAMVGKEITMKDSVRLVPDILSNGSEFFFPIFSSAEEMGEYGERFSKIQKHVLEAIALARNNEKDPAGIVLNAFTEPFILDKQLYDIVEKMKSRIVEE